MAPDPYRPIDCGLHSRYELLAMRRVQLSIIFFDENGARHSAKGRIMDLYTTQDGEYLQLATRGGRLEVRLDRILKTSPLETNA